MKLFKPFDLIILGYCLTSSFVGVLIVGFPALKILSEVILILVAHRISWKSLLYINIIDLVVTLVLNAKSVIFMYAFAELAQFERLFIVVILTFAFCFAPFTATILTKFLNKLIPKRLKTERVDYS